MKKLAIIGASGMGKEAVWIAEEMSIFEEIIILDDKYTTGCKALTKDIVGGINQAAQYADYYFSIAIGNPRVRQNIYYTLSNLGITNFTNLIHPKAIISKHITIGNGNIIGPGAVVSVDVEIGDFNIINNNVTIAHDCTINNFCSIAPQATISGSVKLESLVEVGAAASIKQGLSMSKGSLLGMGSSLLKNIEKEDKVYVGSPAKYLKDTGIN